MRAATRREMFGVAGAGATALALPALADIAPVSRRHDFEMAMAAYLEAGRIAQDYHNNVLVPARRRLGTAPTARATAAVEKLAEQSEDLDGAASRLEDRLMLDVCAPDGYALAWKLEFVRKAVDDGENGFIFEFYADALIRDARLLGPL